MPVSKFFSLFAIVLLTFFANGCSVYMAVNQPEAKDTSVLHKNAKRNDVIAALGEPIRTKKTGKGRIDTVQFVQGYSEGTMATRAIVHGTADVLTLGLWEAVGTPTEMLLNGEKIRLQLFYDKHDRLQKVGVLNGSIDIDDKSLLFGQTAPKPHTATVSDSQKRLLDTYRQIRSEYNFHETAHKNPDAYALVIGINHYRLNPDVPYADLSAMAFAELANKTLGVPRENIVMLTNDDASSGQIKAKLYLLKELVNPNGNLYVYYAGHGVPGKDGSAYLLPADMDAGSIALEPALRLDNIYATLAKLPAKRVYVFIDSCFSGKDDSGELLYHGVAPVLKVKKVDVAAKKLTVMTAGEATDFANGYDAKAQRLFSYYLIKTVGEGEIDTRAVYAHVKNEVRRVSLQRGTAYKQIPQLYGNASVPLR